MEVIEELDANNKSWSKERHSSRRIAAADTTAMDALANELAAIRSKIDNMGPQRGEGGPHPEMVDVNYVQNGGQNRQYNNNNKSWSKERHSSRRIAAADTTAMDALANELAAIRSKIDNMGPQRGGGPHPEMVDVNYVQNGGQNRQYNNNNNYRPNNGGNIYNNYSGNCSHPNLPYANNNYLQPLLGFSVTNGAINEPKKENIDDMLRAFMKRTEGNQNTSNARIDL